MKLIEALDYVGNQRPAWRTEKGSWRPPFVYNRAHILRILGANKPVHRITKADVATFRNTLLNEKVNRLGKRRSVGGVNRIVSMLTTLLNDLYEDDIIDKVVKIKGLKENNQRSAYFKKDQIEEMVKRARERGNDELADAILFGVYTGCRQSELLNLQARDVDLTEDRLIFRDTKNGDDFETNISAKIKNILAKRLGVKKGAQKVFDFRNDDHLRDEFYAIRDEMGISDDHVWHCLRHSCGTWLADAGVSINVIASVLNHKTTTTTERYVKRTNAQRKNAIDLL